MKIDTITSAQNPKVKTLLELQEKSKARKREGLFVVEGQRELLHCIEAGYELHAIFVCMDILTEEALKEIVKASESVSSKCNYFSIKLEAFILFIIVKKVNYLKISVLKSLFINPAKGI